MIQRRTLVISERFQVNRRALRDMAMNSCLGRADGGAEAESAPRYDGRPG
jgi:hypothetical protein